MIHGDEEKTMKEESNAAENVIQNEKKKFGTEKK